MVYDCGLWFFYCKAEKLKFSFDCCYHTLKLLIDLVQSQLSYSVQWKLQIAAKYFNGLKMAFQSVWGSMSWCFLCTATNKPSGVMLR